MAYFSHSQEKLIQEQRESSILMKLYFNQWTIPDSPAEPDPENVPFDDPKEIPFESSDDSNRLFSS